MAAVTQQFQPAGSNLGKTIAQSLNFIRGKDVPNFTVIYLDASAKHPAGHSETIFAHNITIGRDSKCNICYGDNYKTVSRQHASITSAGGQFDLNHNPNATNPTLVNGQPINGPYSLRNGDEIQFSHQGPRIRVNMRDTVKSATMGFTSRLGNAMGQALKPYKTAIRALSLLLIASIAFGGYTFMGLGKAEKVIESQGAELVKLEEKGNELNATLDKTKADLAEEQNRAKQDRSRIEALKKKEEEYQKRLDLHRAEMDKLKLEGNKSIDINKKEKDPKNGSKSEVIDSNYPLRKFDKDIYFIRVESMVVTGAGGQWDENQVREYYDYQWSGTGFLDENGQFFTAKHVLEGWKWYNIDEACQNVDVKPVFMEMNNIDNSGDLLVKYKAESPAGDVLRFTNKDVRKPTTSEQTKCGKYSKHPWEAVYDDWATIFFPSRKGQSDIRINRSCSKTLKKGQEIMTSGYARGASLQASKLDPLYAKGTVAQDNLVDKVINATGFDTDSGHSGGPIFSLCNGKYEVIGLVHGVYGNIERVVPIWYVE